MSGGLGNKVYFLTGISRYINNWRIWRVGNRVYSAK